MNNGVDDRQYGTIRMKLAASDIGIYGLGMTHVSAKLHAPNHDLSIRLCVRCKPKPCIVATQRDLNVAENAAHDALLTFSLRLRTLSGHISMEAPPAGSIGTAPLVVLLALAFSLLEVFGACATVFVFFLGLSCAFVSAVPKR